MMGITFDFYQGITVDLLSKGTTVGGALVRKGTKFVLLSLPTNQSADPPMASHFVTTVPGTFYHTRHCYVISSCF